MNFNQALKVLIKASDERVKRIAVNASMVEMGCETPGCVNAKKELDKIREAQRIVSEVVKKKKIKKKKKPKKKEKQMRLM